MKTRRGFSLVETAIGIVMATILILFVIALATAALRGDQKAEMRQIALAIADAELNRLVESIAVAQSPARSDFWTSPEGLYQGSGTKPSQKADNTVFDLEYKVQVVKFQFAEPVKEHNQLRKLDLKVSWWGGGEGKPGFGKLYVRSSRLVRESDIREP